MNKKRKKNVCCIYVFSIMSIRFTRIICCCYLRATTLLASVVSSSVAVFIARFLRKMATTAVVLTLTTDRMTPLSFASRTYSFRVDCEALQSRLLLTRRQREKKLLHTSLSPVACLKHIFRANTRAGVGDRGNVFIKRLQTTEFFSLRERGY